jgi:hypothetical protein
MRITNKQIEAQISHLNRITGSPETPWTRKDGRNTANIGNYHLSQAYGGACVHRMENTGGGVSTPICNGHVPKREIYGLLVAFIAGIETEKN